MPAGGMTWATPRLLGALPPLCPKQRDMARHEPKVGDVWSDPLGPRAWIELKRSRTLDPIFD